MLNMGELLDTSYSHAPIRREHNNLIHKGEHVVIIHQYRKDAAGEWTPRGFEVYGRTVRFTVETKRRALLAAALLETFDGDALQEPGKYTSGKPLAQGVPVAVAAAGKPAIATWLFVRGRSVADVADALDVSRDTVLRYFSRIRADTSVAQGRVSTSTS